MRPSKRYSGRLRNRRMRVVRDRRAVLEIARVVDLGQEEGLAPGAARPARAGAATSSATSTSSASRYMTQSPVAASKDTLRAAEKSPSHSWCRTRAPRLSAISTVRSVEPVSTTTISSTASRAACRQRADHRLLVLDDHAQADGQALGRARGGGDAVDARLQVARRGRRPAPARARPRACGARTRRGCARRWAARGPGAGRRRRAPAAALTAPSS